MVASSWSGGLAMHSGVQRAWRGAGEKKAGARSAGGVKETAARSKNVIMWTETTNQPTSTAQ